jgi:hypothetical protein
MDERQSALFLYEEAQGYTYAAALRAAAALRVADHLTDGPRSAADLAAATGTRPGALARILRLLAARGIMDEPRPATFALTAKGAALRSDAEVPARAGILMFTDRMFWTMCHAAADIARTDPPSFADVLGQTLEQYFEADAGTEALYYEGMATVSEAEHPVVAVAYDFPATGVVADLGGGRGAFLLEVLRQHPALHGVLLDRADRVEHHLLGDPVAAGRAAVVAGDFFGELPKADVYLLKRILHNWGDEDSVRILANVRRAMPPDGRVVTIDAILPEAGTAHQGRAMDYMMLAAMTGQERTAAEVGALYAAAGLRVTRVIATASPMSLVEGAAA